MPLELEYVDNGPLRVEETASLRSLIWRHQPRWRSLLLWLEPRSFVSILAGPSSPSWVTLSELGLWSFDFIDAAEEDSARLYEAVENITSLRHIVVRDHDEYRYTRRYGPIGLRELEIHFDDVFTNHHANLISSYPNLVSLTLILHPHKRLTLSHLILPALSIFVLETDNLAILDYLTTPSLARLEINNLSDKNYLTDPYEDRLSQFLDRCTPTLKSITLYSRTYYDSFIIWALPFLSNRPRIAELTLNIWPISFAGSRSQEDGKETWCPNLQHLTIYLEEEKSIEVGRVEALAAFLKGRQDQGLKQLECLTVHDDLKYLACPSDSFNNVGLGRLCVMVPIQ
jgi:hypothetical protein